MKVICYIMIAITILSQVSLIISGDTSSIITTIVAVFMYSVFIRLIDGYNDILDELDETEEVLMMKMKTKK